MSDHWDDNPHEEDDIIERLSNEVWLTADGTELNIKDMDTNHISNTISLIERKFPSDDYMIEYVHKFKAELRLRGQL